ncbi:MAG: nucleotide-binding protein, partial [Planctomycetia bacterium]
DLVRSPVGYVLAWVGARVLSRSPVVHVDGPRSVAGAFTPTELLALAEEAGLVGGKVLPRIPERFVFVWRRS